MDWGRLRNIHPERSNTQMMYSILPVPERGQKKRRGIKEAKSPSLKRKRERLQTKEYENGKVPSANFREGKKGERREVKSSGKKIGG